MIQYASCSFPGDRESNEDAVRVRDTLPEGICAVLADGLGGHGGGAQASQTAAAVICDGWTAAATPDSLLRLTQEANRRILSLQTPSCQMKTTAVVLSVTGGRFDWASIGDSRLYHFLNGALCWQTTDHSASQLAVLLGQINQVEIRFHEDRSRLYRALGLRNSPGAEAGTIPWSEGLHAFLLCSDGFWEPVKEDEMEKTLRSAQNPEDWLSRMCALLEQRETRDNYSAIAVWAWNRSGRERRNEKAGLMPL